jgi:nickel-dependent lactate racemase
MQCEIKYGRKGLTVDIPDTAQVFHAEKMPLSSEGFADISQSIENPIGSASLAQLARNKKNACIVVSDATRPVPNKTLLPLIIDALLKAGISPENVHILVATGIHRPPTEAELFEMMGEQVLSRHKIFTHNARDRTAITRLGFTQSGTPIDINLLYLESDLKVVVGLVEPHFMAGFSGGRKSIAIGLTSTDAMKHLHGPALLEQPNTRNCMLDGNPLHAELLEIATTAGVDFCVNVVLGNERQIGRIFAGDLLYSHLEACSFANRYLTQPRAGLFDVVLTSSAGYPLDTTFYQAVKGLVGAIDILAPNGTIILAAECSRGLGSSEFRKVLQVLDKSISYSRFLEEISQPAQFILDQWEVEMLVKALKKAKLFFFSEGLCEDDFPLTQARRISSVEEGIALILNSKPDARIAVIPEGPYFIPMAGESHL